MTAFLRRIAYWWRETSMPMRPCPPRSEPSPRGVTCYSPESCMGEDAYLADFGPNVPVEGLGGSYTTETESSGVTGMEKAP